MAQTFKPLSGNVVFKHPTKDFKVTPSFTEDAIILTVEYSDGTIVERHEYTDKNKGSELFVNKPVFVNVATNEATVIED